jgi:hypothetical protein
MNSSSASAKRPERACSPLTVIDITVKCSDLFLAFLERANGEMVGNYEGYVPNIMPPDEDGHVDTDHLHLRVDIHTGQILNWKRPTRKQLKKVFKLKGK